MIPLFNKDGLVVLESLSFTNTLYAFDFDGTLAKIVREPSSAKMSSETHSLMVQLSKLVPVAIISGRSVLDLKKRVAFKPKFLIGNHGLEIQGNENSHLVSASNMCAQWLNILRKTKFSYGIEIEDKKFSLSIHYRKSRKKANARMEIKKVLETLDPKPQILLGKCVFNIVPTGAPHKGTALLRLLKDANIKHAFYIGDDDTDEDIFSLPYQSGQIFTVRVGEKKKSHASYFIKNQREINKIIKLLIKYHQSNVGSKGMKGTK